MKKQKIQEISTWAAALIFCEVMTRFVLDRGMIQFGGCDGGILANMAYQGFSGYRPYAEIVTATPPLWIAGGKWAFDLWGVSWNSLLKMNALFGCITFIVQLTLLRLIGFGPLLSLGLSAFVQCTNTMAVCWWWYTLPSATLSCIFLSAIILLLENPRSWVARVCVVFAAGLLATTKANTAVLWLFTGFVFLVARRQSRIQLPILALCAAGVALGLLSAWGIRPTDLLGNYLAARGRLSFTNVLNFLWRNEKAEVIRTMLLLVPALLAMILIVSRVVSTGIERLEVSLKLQFLIEERNLIWLALWMTTAGCCLATTGTNNSLNYMELSPLMIVSCLLLHKADWSGPPGLWLKRAAQAGLAASLVGLSAAALRDSWTRDFVAYVGKGMFHETGQPLKRLDDPSFFRGMAVTSRFVGVLRDIRRTLEESGYLGRRDAPVYFGIRLDFGYAAYGILPPRSLPLWWGFDLDPDTSETLVERFRRRRFGLLVFLKCCPDPTSSKDCYPDFTYFPDSLIKYINNDYIRKDLDYITIYFKK